MKTHSCGDLSFWNAKTGESSWYTPDGMTADEIFEIPDAKTFFRSKEGVAGYMERCAIEKLQHEKEENEKQHQAEKSKA